jgi:putative heme transporter
MSGKVAKKPNRWKVILTLVTFLALFGTAYFIRHQILDTFRNLQHVNIWPVLLIIPLEALNYHAQAKLYQGLFKILDKKVPYKFMYKAALELNFVNNVFPSGGVSGFSYFSLRMRSQGISAGKSSLVQLMKLILIFISFQILLVSGLLMLAIEGNVSNLVILIAGSLVTLLLVGTSIIAFVIGSKSRINGFFTFVTRIINRLVHVVRPHHPETLNIEKAREIFTELHENYKELRKRFKELRMPLIYGVAANLTEIGAIYVVYIAFGHWVNPGAVIIAYAIANFAGLVSVLPGGVGIYEGLMTGTLAAGGVPAALSLPVTVMYRVVNFAVQMPVGYYFYQKALHLNQDDK